MFYHIEKYNHDCLYIIFSYCVLMNRKILTLLLDSIILTAIKEHFDLFSRLLIWLTLLFDTILFTAI